MKSAGQSRENTPPPVGAGGGVRRRRDGQGQKAPLADQGWCSAQRIRIWMIAGGNHTIIHAVSCVPRKHETEGIRISLFPSTLCERNLTIPQSKIKDFCQLPLHKGAIGCSRTSAFFGNSHNVRGIVTGGNPWKRPHQCEHWFARTRFHQSAHNVPLALF